MLTIKVIEGEIFNDNRGQIRSLNSFDFEGIKRMYTIFQRDVNIVRGWHGHKFERKWFYCIQGAFTLALVAPDDWENPSRTLEPNLFQISSSESKIVAVPAGFANCLKATVPDSSIMVFSDKTIQEARDDSWRYDSSMWVNW